MKKYSFSLIFMCIFLICQTSYAQNLKTITLNDGSEIKGNIVGLDGETYFIKTSFGTIEVEDSNITSISSSKPLTESSNPSSRLVSEEQMTQYQQQILGNPKVASEIESISRDPQIQKVLSDPELTNAIMAQDFQKIQNNPKFQKLLQNPKMQSLIQSAGQSIGR